MTQQKAPKLLPFKVTRTPKIKDSTGAYVKRGDTAQLTKELAQHYHDLGYVQVSMEGMFDDDPDPTKTDSDGPKPDSSAGVADEREASDDASSDPGNGSDEDGSGYAAKSRRGRASR